MKKIIKLLLLSCLLIGSLLTLSGCGSVYLTTKTTISSDSSFDGNRNITIDLGEMLYEVSGGMDVIKESIERHMPANEMSYYLETEEKIVFSINFDSLDSYREKVKGILLSGGMENTEPNIIFDMSDSTFKHGLVYKENFSSVDLLMWFVYGLAEDGILPYDYMSKNYLNIYKPSIVIGEKEYVSNNEDSFSIDEQEGATFDNIAVTTSLQNDKYQRTIVFAISNENKNIINQSTNLSSYMRSLCNPSKDVGYFDVEEEGMTYYYFIFEKNTIEEIVETTNEILQTNNNSLSISIEAPEDSDGYTNLNITDCLDGSVYLPSNSKIIDDFDSFKNLSDVHCYVGDNEVDSYDGRSLSMNHGEVYNFSAKWLISPTLLEIKIDGDGINKEEVTLYASYDLFDDNVIDSAEKRLSKFIEFGGKLERSGKNIVISFKGDKDKVEKEISNFSSGEDDAEPNFFVEISKAYANNIWKKAKNINVVYDFEEVFGPDIKVSYKQSDSIMSSSFSNYGLGSGKINAIQTDVSFIGFALLGLVSILFVGGIVLIILGFTSKNKNNNQFIENQAINQNVNVQNNIPNINVEQAAHENVTPEIKVVPSVVQEPISQEIKVEPTPEIKLEQTVVQEEVQNEVKVDTEVVNQSVNNETVVEDEEEDII